MKTDVYACLSSSQAGINNRVLIKSVDISCKFKINTTSDNSYNIQKQGTILYDSFELSFNTVDKTSILKLIILIYWHS